MPTAKSKPSGEAGDPRLAPIQARGMMPPILPREAVANALRERIKAGVYQPGELLPSLPQIVAMTAEGASRNTIADAIRKLSGEGYVKSVQGVGVYVMTPEYWDKPPA